jgi:hypothetical protein
MTEIIHTVPKFIEWWEVENTGWSGGTSWFSAGGTRANPYRARSAEQAIEYITAAKWDDEQVKWRYVHVTLEREGNREVKTRVWTLVE